MQSIPTLRYYKTHPNARIPMMSTEEAACYDLCAHLHGPVIAEDHQTEIRDVTLYTPENKVIPGKVNTTFNSDHPESYTIVPARHRAIIPTGIIFEIPTGYSVRLHPRSGLSIKQGFIVANCEGVIDSDYFHEIKALMVNNSDVDIQVRHGDRICQAELMRVEPHVLEETKNRPEQKTDRVGGLGSTGLQ